MDTEPQRAVHRAAARRAAGRHPAQRHGLVDALEEEAGFVARTPHPADRRATLVTLTAKGERMPAARFRGFTDGLDEVLRRLRGAVTG